MRVPQGTNSPRWRCSEEEKLVAALERGFNLKPVLLLANLLSLFCLIKPALVWGWFFFCSLKEVSEEASLRVPKARGSLSCGDWSLRGEAAEVLQ